MFNKLATEGSCRKRRRRFWSRGVMVGRLVSDGPMDSWSEMSGSVVGSGTDFGRSLVGVTKLGIALGNSVREITVRSCTLTVYVVRGGGVGSRLGSGVGHKSMTEHP